MRAYLKAEIKQLWFRRIPQNVRRSARHQARLAKSEGLILRDDCQLGISECDLTEVGILAFAFFNGKFDVCVCLSDVRS
jgi:hypothetical protein